MRHPCINFVDRVVGCDSFESLPLPVELPLNRQILNDLEYGVSSRPSIPACFDDDDAVSSGSVDDVTDMRYSPWDSAAQKCRFRPSDEPVTIGEQVASEVVTDGSVDSADQK